MKKILSIFTTASRLGVTTRYLTVIVGTVLSTLGLFNVLNAEQVRELSASIPELIKALGTVAALLTTVYGIVTKSFSDPAAEAAKKIDDKVPAGSDIVIQTPPGIPNIVVPASRSR